MTIPILPKNVFFKLVSITGILLLLNIISIAYRINFMPTDVFFQTAQLSYIDKHILLLVKYFDFNQEVNVPTLYSTLLLFTCAVLLMLLGWKEKREKNKYLFWTIFSIIFIFLSMDEFIQLHEALIWPTRFFLNTSGFLFFAWVIPYGILLIILALLSYKFLLQLPKKTLKLFLVAGGIYVFGALIIEMPEGWVMEKYGYNSSYFAILYTIEEFLEMIGLNIFIYALLSFKSYTLKIS